MRESCIVLNFSDRIPSGRHWELQVLGVRVASDRYQEQLSDYAVIILSIRTHRSGLSELWKVFATHLVRKVGPVQISNLMIRHRKVALEERWRGHGRGKTEQSLIRSKRRYASASPVLLTRPWFLVKDQLSLSDICQSPTWKHVLVLILARYLPSVAKCHPYFRYLRYSVCLYIHTTKLVSASNS
jgi:hypothetical protein